jgi:hypothetical protein
MGFLMRIFAFIVGTLAAVLGLVINVLYSASHDVLRLSGSSAATTTHGWIGLGLVIVGFLGAIAAIFWPWVGMVLMIVAGIGLCFVLHWFAIFVTPLFLVGAAMAYTGQTQFERRRIRREAQRSSQLPAAGTMPPAPLPS